MNSETNENVATTVVEEVVKEWTVMIYMAGDNNLSADMAYALADIRESMKGKNDKLNLMVYYDGSAFNAPTLYCDFTEFEKPIYCPSGLVNKAFKDKRKKDDEEPEFDENSGAVYSLMNFINWCVNDTTINLVKDEKPSPETHKGRKAKKYALICSGHGSAFQNMSLMVDANSDYYMTIPKLRWALEQITKKEAPFKQETSLLKQEIDILGFDSCVMGMAELAYEFRNVAKTMVASEGSIPSAGWTYGNILSELIVPSSRECETDEKAIAAGFVKKFIEKQNEFMIGGVSVDIAALDLSKIKTVIETTNELGKRLSLFLKSSDDEISERLRRLLLFTHWECQSYMSEQNVDLKDFCKVFMKNIANLRETLNDKASFLIKTCPDVVKAINECVLLCGFSGGTYQYSNGIAIFFPWTQLSYYKSQDNYEKLQVLKYSNPLKDWNQFLIDFTESTLREPRQVKKSDLANNDKKFRSFYYPMKNNQLANDKNNFIATDRNTHIGNDRNSHIGNDRNTHIGNDRGLQQFLMTQFKNTDSPWNISGFTKDVDQPEKVEEPPNEAA